MSDQPTAIRPTGPAGAPGAYPAADALMDFLAASARSLRDHPAHVEAFPDPKVPGLTVYLVSGELLSVQSMCLRLMETVDVALGGKPGRASFRTPIRDADGVWCALGEVVIAQVSP